MPLYMVHDLLNFGNLHAILIGTKRASLVNFKHQYGNLSKFIA
jgi:hypothetical protein